MFVQKNKGKVIKFKLRFRSGRAGVSSPRRFEIWVCFAPRVEDTGYDGQSAKEFIAELERLRKKDKT